jgi:uncharacterized OB-fold protein
MMSVADVEMKGAMAQWQEYLEAGRLMLQCCRSCAKHVFYPRVLCPHCGSDALAWTAASGAGTVYSTTVVARREGDGGPYNVALIDLDEGVRMMSRVEGAAPDQVAIGQRVNAFIGRIDEKAAVLFKPAR